VISEVSPPRATVAACHNTAIASRTTVLNAFVFMRMGSPVPSGFRQKSERSILAVFLEKRFGWPYEKPESAPNPSS
jgi:hypothetical protein